MVRTLPRAEDYSRCRVRRSISRARILRRWSGSRRGFAGRMCMVSDGGRMDGSGNNAAEEGQLIHVRLS